MGLDLGRSDLTLGVVGAGQMGRGIAQIAAVAGIAVRLLDTKPGAAEAALSHIRQMVGRIAQKGRMRAADADAAIARLRIVEAVADLAGCDVVVEAIVEDLAAKQALFRALEAAVAEDCILATNTSSLSVTRIAAACAKPARVAGYHFFNPVPLMKVVEVIGGARTDPVVLDALSALATRMGHRPVRVVDTPGFLVNHAGRGYGTEALRILSEGVAEPIDIDRVMREAAGFPMGPFELMDFTGLDISLAASESIYRQFYDEPRFRPSPEIGRRVAAGLLGRKTGAGFYRYDADGGRIVPAENAPPPARSAHIWVSDADPDGARRIRAALWTIPGLRLDRGGQPAKDALCLVAPLGGDATTAAVEQGLDPARTIAVDTLFDLNRRVTVMATPLTTPEMGELAVSVFAATGVHATLIADSPGFIAQRILASVVNVACDIAQQRIASPADIDDAVRLGLGYPRGPLEGGDALGPRRVLTILENLLRITGDPRYRPSPWLRRRALLGISLTAPDRAG